MPILELRETDKFRYDKGENRRKHNWKNPIAGVVREGGCTIGKCPKGFLEERCRELLNTGIAVYDTEAALPDFPSEIWAVEDGVVYYATPSELGKCYHAYPVKEVDSPEIMTLLKLRAQAVGTDRKLKHWMKSGYDQA